MGCFASVTLLSASDLGSDYRANCGDFVRTYRRRGYGFWSWKPYIIHRHLASLQAGDVVLYLDAGYSLNPEWLSRFKGYFDSTISHPSGWFAFESGHLVGPYTKRSLLLAHDADDESTRALPMLMAGCQFILARPDNVELARKWHEAMQVRDQIDDSPAPNELEGFVAHRHDQCVFSILGHRRGVAHSPDETNWSPNWSAHQAYPLHARRWKHRFDWPTAWMRLPWLGSMLRRL
ncbi:MAG: hypothetical protein EBU04_07880 [Verrucomicrobia bacterium]|nr:hypothetical protein [Verrucomicrobiota bacterium]NBS05189.1 hypothetical protein [Verrucomicrobiota bacterium]NBY36660.1 hypothetical protein [Verrucomicrobiota bacterium]